jgi:uncharacterized protein
MEKIIVRNTSLKIIRLWLFTCCTLTLVSCGIETPQSTNEVASMQPRELEWSELMPKDYDPNRVIADVDISEFSDSDPRALRYSKMLREAWSDAPVVSQLDGQNVKIPGFAVPIEYDEKNVSQFLLVPYFGACIHSPAPPSNQIINVQSGDTGINPDSIWDPIWVTGVLRTERLNTEAGDASYSIESAVIEPYIESTID